MQTFLFSILVIGNILFGVPVHAQTPELDEGLLTPPETSYARGKVMRILNEEMDDNLSGFEREVQTVQIRVLTGNEKGEEVTLENGILQNRADMRLHEGETVILEKLHKTNGEVSYLIREKYRLPSVVLLVLIFVALSFVFGRLTGLMSMVGLLVSVLILTFFVVPQIVKGMNPMIASLIGAFAIACTSLYLAHGFKKTHICRTAIYIDHALYIRNSCHDLCKDWKIIWNGIRRIDVSAIWPTATGEFARSFAGRNYYWLSWRAR
jgi:uncharacterized membrane protein